MTLEYGPIAACQCCASSNLRPVLFLGFLPPVNTMRDLGQGHDGEQWFPAEVFYCPECHLTQLGYAVEPEILFPPTYPYTSGTTRSLHVNFEDLYRETNQLLGLTQNDLVVDIGSNDGTLLSKFQTQGLNVIGIEPTEAGELARGNGIPTMSVFFGPECVDQILQEHGAPRVVTATNVFAHIHGINDILDHIARLTGPDGVFVSESHYLLGLVETLQYDTIYHEHLRYYSILSLKNLLGRHGFHIFHVTAIPTHGGSVRVYASRSEAYPVRPSVDEFLRREAEAGLDGESWIEPFRKRVLESKLLLYELLAGIKRQDKTICGIGAPSRSSTLINYVGLDDGILDSVLEISGSRKIGKFVPGRNIPVLDEESLYRDQPAYAMLLSWHIGDELCRNLKRRGFEGDFIYPLPTPSVVCNRDVEIP